MKEKAKKFIEEFKAKKAKSEPTKITALERGKPFAASSKKITDCGETAAVLRAEIGGFQFDCSIDSGADLDAI